MVKLGHFLTADTIGSAVEMPYFFAGIDFASTIPCLVEESPPIIAGIVRISI